MWICPICGKTFDCNKSKCGHMQIHNTAKWAEANKKRSLALMGHPCYGLEGNRQKHLGKKYSDEVNAKKGRKGKKNTLGQIQKQLESRRNGKGFFQTLESNQKNSQWHLEAWKNNFVYAERVLITRKPNLQEQKLTKYLNNFFPGEWKYTGNNGFTIDGKNPDFVRIDGSKFLIEYYGSFWHASPVRYEESDIINKFGNKKSAKDIRVEDEKRIARFEELGWNCLIIWEHELNDRWLVRKKVKTFMQREE